MDKVVNMHDVLALSAKTSLKEKCLKEFFTQGRVKKHKLIIKEEDFNTIVKKYMLNKEPSIILNAQPCYGYSRQMLQGLTDEAIEG